ELGLAQRLALDQLGDHPAIADIVDADNARMVEGRDGSRFLLETQLAHGVGTVFRREELHRHFTIQAGIAGAKNLSHTAGAEGPEDFVRADLLWRRRGHEV